MTDSSFYKDSTNYETLVETGEDLEALVAAAAASAASAQAAVSVGLPFDTHADALAYSGTIPAIVIAITTYGYSTRGDNGGAVYNRVAAQPAHPGYISVGGAYWELDRRQTITPEMLGADYTAADNIVAFQNLALVMNAFVNPKVRLRPNVEYTIYADDASVDAHGVNVMHLQNLRAWEMDFAGATVHLKFTAKTVNFCLVDGCTGGVIKQPNGIQDAPKSSVLGATWFYVLNGSSHSRIVGATYQGGLQGFCCARSVGSGVPRCVNWDVTQACTDVYYPVGLQTDGDNVRFVTVNSNAGRDYIGYNHHSVDGWIFSNNSTNDSVLIDCYGHDPVHNEPDYTRDIHIRYVNIGSTNIGSASALACSHQQGSNTTAAGLPTKIEGVVFEAYIDTSKATVKSFGNLFVHDSWVWDVVGSTQKAGQPPGGNKFDITIKGHLTGPLDPSGALFAFASSSRGWTVGSGFSGQYTIGPLVADGTIQPIVLGQDVRAVFSQVYAPFSSITWEGTPNPLKAAFHDCLIGSTLDPNAGTPASGAAIFASKFGHALSLFAPSSSGFALSNASDGSGVMDTVFDGASVYDRAYSGRGFTWMTGGAYRVTIDASGYLKPFGNYGSGLGTAAAVWGPSYIQSITFGDGVAIRPKALTNGASSPYDFAYLDSIGATGGWVGAIGFRTGDSGGALSERVRITSTDGLQVFGDLSARPSALRTPANNGDLVIEATSNTALTFKFKGSDGVVRSGSLTLA